MGFTTMTAVAVVSPFSSPNFHDDATGGTCLDFAGQPPTMTITNLDAVGYRMFYVPFTPQCAAAINTGLGFVLGPGEFRVFDLTVSIPSASSVGIVAEDVGPGSYHIRVEWGATGAPCGAGTRMKVGQQSIQFINDALLQAIFAPFAALELLAFYVGFVGTQYVVERLCASLPPVVPIYTGADLLRSVTFLQQLLDAAAWPLFCECVPATPTPQPPAPPVITIPPDLATRPVNVCDPQNLCAAIIQLLDQVGRLQTVVGQLWALTNTTQRYGVPFASIPGPSNAGLTGSGAHAIARVVALHISVTARPVGLQEFTGAPLYISDLGWISAFTDDGMLDEIRLTRDEQVWASKLLPFATQVGWGLRQGVTVTIEQLLAEP
jgi:hypothetical protein